MLKEGEGCCIEQIAYFCKQVTYYVSDFKHKLFEANKADISNNQNGLPRLVSTCANHHIYPITDEERRHTIFKTSSTIGGGIRTYRTQQRFEHKMNNGIETQIRVLHNDMSFHGLLEHVEIQKEEALRTHFEDTSGYEECEEFPAACSIDSHDVSNKTGVYRIIVTRRGLCNDISYNEIGEFGNIHNGHVKLNKHSQVVSLKCMEYKYMKMIITMTYKWVWIH